ncbi:putative metabolite transport protein [Neolecta irregularis DAH-3]|uniref:Putative metabolite transport protein n=1 Tax=Neolecta irregularis (strain DAH-3) TaxID=1198029 RepID=A0A1U7LX37_NEOID|nr:putative metabolite transport protein [Neolecta irregularis DAH-3]|eukprot:OLL27122.1 putative metabolite transport protein [Neolecta irregularis DAH-3]
MLSKASLYISYNAFAIALGSFQFGLHLGEMNSPENVVSCRTESPISGILPSCVSMTTSSYAFATAIFAIGGLLGALMGPCLVRMGRKTTLLFNTIPGILGPLLMALAINPGMLTTGRLISGVQSGLAMAIVPQYLSEITPKKWTGPVGLVPQLSCVLGILFTQALALGLSNVPGWRIIFSLGGFIQLTQSILLIWAIESPLYYYETGSKKKAEQTLKVFLDHQEASSVIDAWDASGNNSIKPRPSLEDIWHAVYDWRKAFAVISLLMLGQQLCGINVVIFYSTTTLNGLLGSFSKYLSVIISIVNLFATLLMALFSNRIGRKIPLLHSVFGMTACSALMCFGIVKGIGALTAIAAVAFVASFGVGLGPMPFPMAVEVVNGAAVVGNIAPSFGVAVNLLATFVIAYIFPPLREKLGGYVFIIFVVIGVMIFVLFALFVPETSKKQNAGEIWTRSDGTLMITAAANIVSGDKNDNCHIEKKSTNTSESA